ncbi:MAG: class I SAM-dependent methyltransferase [Proteobacteria bacterium]|nr:class I SAM-dependent methyltransferase [Pseudomonadota bacterium]MDA0927590.1 class I SAM-dependent methyltransferase [Pseudomonadota bacterium]
MHIKDLATVKAYHSERVVRFGQDAREALGWKNDDSQRKRFEALLQLGDVSTRSVLDLGCGHGDLYPFLRQHCGAFTYIGVDTMRDFLVVAAARYGKDPHTRFLLSDFSSPQLPVCDFVVCCGALNYRQSDPAYLRQTISRFFGLCTEGLALSLLHRVDFADGILVPTDPEQVWDICRDLNGNTDIQMADGEDFFTVLQTRI